MDQTVILIVVYIGWLAFGPSSVFGTACELLCIVCRIVWIVFSTLQNRKSKTLPVISREASSEGSWGFFSQVMLSICNKNKNPHFNLAVAVIYPFILGLKAK